MRILRQDIDKLGYKRNFSIYDEGDKTGLIKKIITRTAAKDEKLDPNVAKNLISKAKNNGWRETAPGDEQTLAGAVFARYQAELKTLNAVDFDDLLLLTVKLLSEHAEVRERWQRRFRYLMVDEFQDTNRLQLELVIAPRRCAEERGRGRRRRSIDLRLARRGGEQHPRVRGALSRIPTVVKLEQNYRSTNAILNTANALIKNNPRRRPKQLWSAAGDGAKVRIIQMQRRPAGGGVHRQRNRAALRERRLRHEDFAVLFRMNAQSRLRRSEPARAEHPVSRRRREKLLRSARDQGFPRLRERASEHGRRRVAAAHHQHAGARHQREHGRAGDGIERAETSAASSRRCRTRSFGARSRRARAAAIDRVHRVPRPLRDEAEHAARAIRPRSCAI